MPRKEIAESVLPAGQIGGLFACHGPTRGTQLSYHMGGGHAHRAWHIGAAGRDGACAPKAHDATDPRQPGLSVSKNIGPAKRACRKDHRAPGPSPSGPNSPGKPSGNRVPGRGNPANPKRATGPLMAFVRRSNEDSAMPSRAAIEIAKRFRKI